MAIFYVLVVFHVVCEIQELAEACVREKRLGAIRTFLEAHRDVFDLEEQEESVVVRLGSVRKFS